MQQGSVTANDVAFTFLEVGPYGDVASGRSDAPLALLLHGFPDTAHTWRYLAPALADAGYRVVAPFLRGYAPTAVPADGMYQTGALGADANALHAALGGDERAVIIGHDWGATATYAAASGAPERWAKVITMAVPPGEAMGHAFLTNLDQLQRSWYMFVFQHPLADLLVPADEHAFVARLWAQWSPGYDHAVDVAHVRDALADPANVHAALGYYRATLGDGPRDERYAAEQAAATLVPSQPALYLHGADDGCIGAEVADVARAATGGHVRFETIEHAGHFLHLEQPDRVAELVTGFLA